MENGSQKDTMRIRQGRIALVTAVSMLVIDQIIKIMVKTGMPLYDYNVITSWFEIRFVENNGMAFGMEILGKLFLSLFRIVAIGFFIWYLVKIVGKGFPTGYIVTLSFILAGATGNLVDCMFYGLIFDESSLSHVASFVPIGEGYAPFLYGKVVDMFYFPLWTWPEWMPLVGGDVFFGPIFNFADACISCGVVVLLLFYTKYINMGLHFHTPGEEKPETDEKE